jgi:molybdate transport repressor ModE-like protein
MRLVPTLAWSLDSDHSEPLDARLLPLLASVATTGSLAAAVTARGMSYRAAWGLLRDYQQRLGAPLVALERGRGARLTPPGQAFLQAQDAAARRLARLLPGLAVDLGAAPAAARGVRPLRLRVAASHDLALAALSDTLRAAAGVELDLSVMGSLHALREYAEGRADVAGFHVPIDRRNEWDRAPFLRWLRARRDQLVRFVDREQGLILPRGNPAGVKGFRDIAARKLRFVNRQRGSGTRLAIDRRIVGERVEPSALDGYGNEEFTHAAVAATVASGGADAGFGLRAAAAEYGLAFVPLVRERYFLAVRATDVGKAPVVRLVDALRNPSFARLARRLPGYHAAAAGTVTGLDALGPAPGTTSAAA